MMQSIAVNNAASLDFFWEEHRQAKAVEFIKLELIAKRVDYEQICLFTG